MTVRLLLDENLSECLLPRIKDLFSGSAHVRRLGEEDAPDRIVWEMARRGDDEDFVTLNSIFPKSLESLWTQLGVAHRVRDVLVPEVLLDRSRVVPLVRKLVAGRVTEHVRMDGEGEFRE